MNNLSQREKKLLYILAMVVIIVGGFKLIIEPLSQKYMSLQDQFIEAQYLSQEYKTTIATKEILSESIVEVKNQIEDYQKLLFAPMTNPQMDKFVSGLLLEYSLTPVSSDLLDISYLPILPYGKVYEDSEAEEAAIEAAPTMLGNNVAYTATGKLDDMIALIDYVSTNSSIRVESFSANISNASAETVAANILYDFTINFVVYMKG